MLNRRRCRAALPSRIRAVAAQNAIELRAKPFDRPAAGVVEEVGAELHGDAVQVLEGVAAGACVCTRC